MKKLGFTWSARLFRGHMRYWAIDWRKTGRRASLQRAKQMRECGKQQQLLQEEGC